MQGDFNFNRRNPYSNILEFQDIETLGQVAAPDGGGYSPDGGNGGGYGGYGGYGGHSGYTGGGSNSNPPAAVNTIAISPTNTVTTTQSATALLPTAILNQQLVRPSEVEKLEERLAKMKRVNTVSTVSAVPSLANRSRSTAPEEKQSMFASVFNPIIKTVPAPVAKFLSNPTIQTALVVGFGSAAALLILHLISKKRGRK